MRVQSWTQATQGTHAVNGLSLIVCMRFSVLSGGEQSPDRVAVCGGQRGQRRPTCRRGELTTLVKRRIVLPPAGLGLGMASTSPRL